MLQIFNGRRSGPSVPAVTSVVSNVLFTVHLLRWSYTSSSKFRLTISKAYEICYCVRNQAHRGTGRCNIGVRTEIFDTNSDLHQGTDNRDSIVFIHGLTGGREKTWTHEDGTFWPQDLLPSDFAKARILIFGYDADIAHIFGQASINTLRDHGRTLCTDLTMLRLRTSSVSHGGFLCIDCRHGCSGSALSLHVKSALSYVQRSVPVKRNTSQRRFRFTDIILRITDQLCLLLTVWVGSSVNR